MARRCLDCGRFVQVGSRCGRCRLAHERARDRARGPRRDTATQARWARAIKDRDGWRCKVCGGTDHLVAHHIRPLATGGGYSMSNGVTLCKRHHEYAHHGGGVT